MGWDPRGGILPLQDPLLTGCWLWLIELNLTSGSHPDLTFLLGVYATSSIFTRDVRQRFCTSLLFQDKLIS